MEWGESAEELHTAACAVVIALGCNQKPQNFQKLARSGSLLQKTRIRQDTSELWWP
jgi:deoxycytidylate deaminase